MGTKTITVWDEKINEIYKLFGQPNNLNKAEFELFCEMGKAQDLNPFLGEIFATKFGGKVKIFIGRDGYRKNANSHPRYDGHSVDSIYLNDTFKMKGGIPEHTYAAGDRGTLVGAYCVVYIKDRKVPAFVKVSFDEYDRGTKKGDLNSKGEQKGNNTWNEIPETMIKKVAESQGLRMAFPDKFNGTYDASENWTDNTPLNAEFTVDDEQPNNNGNEIKLTEAEKAAENAAAIAAANRRRPIEPVDNTAAMAATKVLDQRNAAKEETVNFEDLPKEPPAPRDTEPVKPKGPDKEEETAGLDPTARQLWKDRIYTVVMEHSKIYPGSEAMVIFDKLNAKGTTDAEISRIEKTIYNRVYNLEEKQAEVQKALTIMGKIWDSVHLRNSVMKHLGTDDVFAVKDLLSLIRYQDHLRKAFVEHQNRGK